MKFPGNQAELQDLFSRVCDQQATDSELAWLNRALNSDPQIRYLYWEYLAAEAQVRSWVGESSDAIKGKAFASVDFEEIYAAPLVEPDSVEGPGGVASVVQALDWRQHPIRAALVVAAMAAVVWGFGIGILGNRPEKMASQPSASVGEGVESWPVVARVVQDVDAQWGDQSPSFAEGSPLKRHQVLQLSSGFCVVEFNSGARAVLRGPTTFVVTGPNQGSLEVGELTAQVTLASHGFQVLTPHATVVDLGTQFGVQVGKDGAGAVQVFEGSVDLVSDQAEKPVRLMWGTALSLSGNAVAPSTILEFVREHLLPSQDQEASSVHADENGVLQLLAEDAQIVGGELVYDNNLKALVSWKDKSDSPVWNIYTDESREYQIELQLACRDEEAGGSYALKVDGNAVGDSQVVLGTETWRKFQKTIYGKVVLGKGHHALSVVSRKDPAVIMREGVKDREGLMNLRSITLLPIK